jgi:hypothetical protein
VNAEILFDLIVGIIQVSNSELNVPYIELNDQNFERLERLESLHRMDLRVLDGM